MADAITISIATVDRTHVIPFRVDPADEQSQIDIEITSPGIATMRATIWDQTNSININDNDLIVVTDPTTPGNNAFQGYINRRRLRTSANYRFWDVDCADLNSWLDLKLVGVPDGSAFLQDPPGTYISYDPNAVTQGSDSATISWLFAVYASDLPIDTTTFVTQLAPGLPAGVIRWNTVTLRQALDDLAAYVNPAIRYWIDADWKFHWTISASPTIPVGGTPIGPLVRMFPVLGYGPAPTAPRALTDGTADGTTTFNYDGFSVEWDDQGWADSIYINGSTGYTYDVPTATVLTGGSGWVDNIIGVGRQRLAAISNSDTQSTRDSFGGTMLAFASLPVRRGTARVTCAFGGWFPGQALSVTNSQAGFSAVPFMIQRVATQFISGDGKRVVGLDWGDAPPGTIGLRRNAQGRKQQSDPARRAATKMLVTVSNTNPGVSGVVRIQAQAVDSAGNAWPVSGKVTTWTVQAFDIGCNDVTGSTPWSLSANPTTTNIHGMAWTDLTVASTTGVTYYVTASCVST